MDIIIIFSITFLLFSISNGILLLCCCYYYYFRCIVIVLVILSCYLCYYDNDSLFLLQIPTGGTYGILTLKWKWKIIYNKPILLLITMKLIKKSNEISMITTVIMMMLHYLL